MVVVPDITFPSGGSIHNLANFSKAMKALPERETLVIDASCVTFLRPTCMIILARACRTRNRRFKNEKVLYRGIEKLSYANNLGFSEALNLEGNPFPQGAFGGKSYIPLSIMTQESLEDEIAEEGFELGDAIDRRCQDIAKIVSQDRSSELRNILARSFREIFRNCFEHGSTENAVFCAQYWKNLNVVEICVADRGVGVLNSLKESKHTKPKTDEEA